MLVPAVGPIDDVAAERDVGRAVTGLQVAFEFGGAAAGKGAGTADVAEEHGRLPVTVRISEPLLTTSS